MINSRHEAVLDLSIAILFQNPKKPYLCPPIINNNSIMATVTRENIGLLTDKIIVNVSKGDYLPSFEKTLKQYGKQANIPGFRKGMVPAGLIKKMYGNSVFTEEVLK